MSRLRLRTEALSDERSATNPANFALEALPPGTYAVRAELMGFETLELREVTVRGGENTYVPITLDPAECIEAVYVDFGFDRALQEAPLIARLRIERSGAPQRCTVTRACVCTEHVATVMSVLKEHSGVREGDQIVLVLENGDATPAGRADARSSSEKELIAFLRGTFSPDHFVGLIGSGYVFPVQDGRVTFTRTDARMLSDGMAVERFERALAGLVSRAR